MNTNGTLPMVQHITYNECTFSPTAVLPLPDGAYTCGRVDYPDGDVRTLICLTSTGTYAGWDGRSLRSVDQRLVRLAAASR